MKNYSFLWIMIALLAFMIPPAQAQVMNPNDAVFDYNPNSPPGTPPSGAVAKWVRTKRLNWNTDDFKSYYFNGMAFRLRFPKNYDPSGNTKYPLIMMFHGRGEWGSIYDNENNLRHSAAHHNNNMNNGNYDGFLFYPQNTSGFWSDGHFNIVHNLINNHFPEIHVDPDRIVVHGLSAGGSATWNYIAKFPKDISAALPMSAASTNFYPFIPQLKHIPIWLSQGGQDRNPAPFTSRNLVNEIASQGGNIRYIVYPNQGHGVWNTHYNESDFFSFINRAHKTVPLVLKGELFKASESPTREVYEFLTQSEVCSNEDISVTLGLTPGFQGYEWRKDGEVIPDAISNEYTATEFGVYDARFRRGNTWSIWSKRAIEIKIKEATETPNIVTMGLASSFIPAPDGKNYVDLQLPEGYNSYTWRLEGSTAVLGNQRIFRATTAGSYVATVSEKFGCSSNPSTAFKVIQSSGTPAPAALVSQNGFATSKTGVKVFWTLNPNDPNPAQEIEIYRSEQSGGGFELIQRVDPLALEFLDEGLNANSNYFYVLRPINQNGAGPMAEELAIKTELDSTPPTTPLNLSIASSAADQISLKWEASTDDVGVHRYDIYRNGVKSVTTESTEATIFNLIEGNFYKFQVKARDLAGNESPFSNQVVAAALPSGLAYKYFHGNWTMLPNFNNLTPIVSGYMDNFDISSRLQDDHFAFYFEGKINIPVAGKYTFETRSDDGSKLYIGEYDEANLVVDNDGIHGMRYREGTYTFPSPGSYTIVLTYFERTGGQGLEVYWKNTAHGVGNRQRIPDSALKQAVDFPEPPPQSPSGLQAEVTSFSSVSLSWQDNSANEVNFQVYRSENGGVFVPIQMIPPNTSTYLDSTLKGSTSYQYKVVALGTYGTSDPTAVVEVTTPESPPLPELVDPLILEPVDAGQILLRFSPSAGAETFTIYQAMGQALNFVQVKSITNVGVEIQFIDKNLLANTSYYYVVQASNLSGKVNSDTFTIQTLNNPPVLTEIQSFTLRYGTLTELDVYAYDPDGDPLELSASNLPSFAELVDYGDGTGLLQLSPEASEQGNYDDVIIQAKDDKGGYDEQTFTIVVNNNHVPTLQAITSLSMEEGESMEISFEAFDEEGTELLQWEFQTLPEFAEFVQGPDGNAGLLLKPGYADAGIYEDIQVKVIDEAGASASRSFSIEVIDVDPNLLVQVNMRHTLNGPNGWNNIGSIGTFNLNDTNGEASGIIFSIVNNVWNSFNQGAQSSSNDRVAPNSVLKDYYYFGIFNSPNTITLKFSGLALERSYDLSFIASSVWVGTPDNGTTVFSSNEESASVYAQGNTKETANLTNLSPNEQGEILVVMSKAPGTSAGYLNGFRMASIYGSDQIPDAPRQLQATLVESDVQLNWVDAPYNEEGYHVYRSNSEGGPFERINSEPLAPNSKDYLDKNILDNQNYYYAVSAFNVNGESAFSNTAELIVPTTPPSMEILGSLTAFVGKESLIQILVSNPPSNQFTLTHSTLPAFITFESKENGGDLILQASLADIGFHSIILTAQDDQGTSSELSLLIEVQEALVFSVFLNFSRNFNQGSPWNNTAKKPAQGDVYNNLMNQEGQNSGVSVTLTSAIGDSFDQGAVTGNNSGVVPDQVLKEYYYFGVLGAPDEISFKVSGLDYSHKYNFKFIGSSIFSGLGVINNGETDYLIGNRSVSLNVQDNTQYYALIDGVTANAQGEIFFKAKKGNGASVGYINAVIIEAYGGDESLFVPSDLFAVAQSKNAISLSWSANAIDELGYEIYRSSSGGNGPFNLVHTTSPDAVAFVDTGLTEGTVYHYKIRAKYTDSFSEYSNTASGGTIAFTIFVNVNGDPLYDQAVPWNNLSVAAQTGDVLTSFKNSKGGGTGMAMEVVMGMQGSNSWGTSTGNNSGIYPDNVMKSFYFNDRLDPAGEYKMMGLDLAYRYNFTFFGAIVTNLNIITNFSIEDKMVSNQQSNNTSQAVSIRGVSPSNNGEILFKVQENGGSNWAIFNAFTIDAFPIAPDEENFLAGRTSQVPYYTAMDGDFEVRYGLSDVEILLYPNPAREHLNLILRKAPAAKAHIRMVDLRGIEVYRDDVFLKSVDTHLTLEEGVTGLRPGLYIIQVQIGDQFYFKRLIKE